MLTLLGSLALTALSAAPAPALEGRWIADFDEAVKIAKEEKKDLLVDFTGSDWCGWCIKLHEEVFQHESFYSEAEKHFVLVALDFPRGDEAKAKVPNAARNQELSKQYGIQGFPTILLMNPDGQVFGQTGYQRGGPEAYLEHLDTIAAAGREALVKVGELQKAFEGAADDKAKLAAIGNTIAYLESTEASDSLLTPLFDQVRQGLTLDADNKAGLALKSLTLLLDKGQWDSTLDTAAKRLDPKNEQGLIEKCLMGQIQTVSDNETAEAFCVSLLAFKDGGFAIQDKAQVAMFAGNAANWNASEELLNNPERAILFAEWALVLEPEGQGAEMLKELLEDLRSRTGAQG